MNAHPPPLPHPPPTNRRSSRIGCWVAGILGLLLLVAGLIAILSLASALEQKIALRNPIHDRAVDEFPALKEIWSYGNGETKVARIAVEGLILREVEDGLFGPTLNMVDSVLAQIRAAKADPDVRAILLEVDSPGGGITASDEIYRALVDFRESGTNRVVVIFMRDLAASGGYYISMAGDWLIAQPTTVLGSIGVIMQTVNIKGLSEKLGIRDVTIKSGPNKDLLNPFEEVDPAQRRLVQEMIDDMFEHFLGIVAQNRSRIPADQLRTLADGRLFVAPRALELGLVDQIGYWEDVMAKTAELLGVPEIKVIRYEEPLHLWGWLMSVRKPIHPTAWIRELMASPKFLYLWAP
ncbi:MAG: signal peptide peptidase SppA [Kiritimatiellae bacterium]|nr:signal peptide peptidase SppA [Kiritimatiellia bacterium]MDW8458401.1 signal peptide peptidase SppA [Verrucomicrobiota bacterium]